MIRVAAIGDLHVGADCGGTSGPMQELRRVSRDADLLLLAGDLTKCGAVEEAACLARTLATIDVPVLGVLGNHDYEATAYSVEGKTTQGTRTREGIVAAGPRLLPLGTRILVTGAGRYSGTYVVRDTGHTIKGREIDLYLASDREAKAFGRKSVGVQVLAYGDGARSRRMTPHAASVASRPRNSKTR